MVKLEDSVLYTYLLVITESYEERAIKIESQDAFAVMCVLRTFHVIHGQNKRDEITRDTRSKRA